MYWLVLILALLAGPAAAQGTGLPFTEDFETDFSEWHEVSNDFSIDPSRANGGSSSASGLETSDAEDSGWITRYWGDAENQGASLCPDVDCPGGSTPDIDITFWVFSDPTDFASIEGESRKLAQVLIFDDWGAGHGTQLGHAVSYLTISRYDRDTNGAAGAETNDLIYNHFRRHDENGDPITSPPNGESEGTDSLNVNSLTDDAWNKIRVRMKLNTAADGTGGILKIWLNDGLVEDETDFNHVGGYSGGQTYNSILLTDNGDGPPGPATVQTFWDDVLIQEFSATTPTISGGALTGGSIQ